MLVAKRELTVWLPEVALAPDQAPVAAQLEALVEDQVSWVELPEVTVVGAALSETVGAGVDGGCVPGGGVAGGWVEGGCASGDCELPLPPPEPPPHATRPSTQSDTRNRPRHAMIID